MTDIDIGINFSVDGGRFIYRTVAIRYRYHVRRCGTNDLNSGLYFA